GWLGDTSSRLLARAASRWLPGHRPYLPIQALEFLRLDDPAAVDIGQHAARLLLKPQGKLLGHEVAISGHPPATDERAVLVLHRPAVQRGPAPLIDTAQDREQAADNRWIQRALDEGLPALEGIAAQMSHGQAVDHVSPPSSPCGSRRNRRTGSCTCLRRVPS